MCSSTGAWGEWKDCGLICQVTGAITKHIDTGNEEAKEDFLKRITEPFTTEIMRVRKHK